MATVIDPQAGTHFTGKIFVTPHACDRAAEHLGIDRAKAPTHVMGLLRKAAFIDTVTGDDGSMQRLYAYRGTAFIVDADEDTVITLYPQNDANREVLDSVQSVLAKMLRSARAKEKRETRRITIEIAELNVERAELVLRAAKTTSKRVKQMAELRIGEIDAEIAQLERELREVRREKKNIVKSIAAFV